MIADRGNTIMLYSNKCLIIHNQNLNVVVAKGVRDPKNGFYRLEAQFIKSFAQTLEAFVTHAHLETNDADHHQAMFWHRRMVHLRYQTFYTMSNKKYNSRPTKIDKGDKSLHMMHT